MKSVAYTKICFTFVASVSHPIKFDHWSWHKYIYTITNNTPSMPLMEAHLEGLFFLGL
jgi:hypothetical protein